MPEFAQLPSQEPIFKAAPIVSRAKGAEAMGSIFGKVAETAQKEAKQMQKEHSNAMFMNAAAQTNSIMTEAKVKMMQHPNDSAKIAEAMTSDLDSVSQVPLRESDRGKLNYILSRNKESIKLQAALVDVKQNRMQQTMNFWDAYGQAMPQYSQALIEGDEKKAAALSENILNNAQASVLEHGITEAAYLNIRKSFKATQQRAADIHSLLQRGDASAAEANALHIDPLGEHNADAGTMSANHETHSIANHLDTAMTQADLDVHIYNGDINHPDVLAALAHNSSEIYHKNSQKIMGVQNAFGFLMSNPNHVELDSRMAYLDNTKDNLTSQQDGEFNVYKNYIKELNTKSFWEIEGRTALGARAVQGWIDEKNAINNSVSYGMTLADDRNQKTLSLAKADNRFIHRGIQIAEASHKDPRYITPVPEAIVDAVQPGFALEGDVNASVDQVSRLDSVSRAYLAKQMKTSTQQQVIGAIGLGVDNGMSQDFLHKYMIANQDGHDFSALKNDDAPKEGVIKAQIAHNVSDVIKYFSATGIDQAPEKISGLVTSGLNYVKFRAMQDGDLRIDNIDKYVKEFSDEMSTAYNIRSRGYGMVNTSQITMTKAQQDSLQNYVHEQAQQNFMRGHEGDLNFKAALSKSDITVYLDPTGHVVAKDEGGAPLYYARYTPHLLSAAIHAKDKFKLSPKKKVKLQEYVRDFLVTGD